jgi:hypothetical protein
MSSKNNDSIYTNKSPAGKGDKPRSISKKYWDNFDQINWGDKKEKTNTKRRIKNEQIICK